MTFETSKKKFYQLESLLHLQIQMISIDECLIEKTVCSGSCRNKLNTSKVPLSVYTNKTSFVGISAIVEAECTCNAPKELVCFNGGNCQHYVTQLITESSHILLYFFVAFRRYTVFGQVRVSRRTFGSSLRAHLHRLPWRRLGYISFLTDVWR